MQQLNILELNTDLNIYRYEFSEWNYYCFGYFDTWFSDSNGEKNYKGRRKSKTFIALLLGENSGYLQRLEMLVKPGVDLSRLARPARRALRIVDAVFEKHNQLFVVTSTYEGTHNPSTLHYANLAFDIRLPKKKLSLVLRDLRKALGRDFDIIKEGTHIHIEYDPD